MNVPDTAARGKGIAGRAFDDLPNLLSLLAFFSITAVMFRSIEFALIVTASLGFHELGHAALISFLRMEWRISFGLVGAWTWSPAEERKKISNLANSAIHLAGPAFSLLLGGFALVLSAVSPGEDSHLLLLANFSAQVGILNLLPLGSWTDGGKVVQRVIAPLAGIERIWAALLPLFVTFLILSVYTVAGQPVYYDRQPDAFLLGLLLVAVWMTCSFLLEVRKAGPEEQYTGLPLTRTQGFLLWLLIWGLLALALVISELSPFWLAPEYVMGCLKNITDIMALLVHLLA